jgi:hypothetical protein
LLVGSAIMVGSGMFLLWHEWRGRWRGRPILPSPVPGPRVTSRSSAGGATPCRPTPMQAAVTRPFTALS